MIQKSAPLVGKRRKTVPSALKRESLTSWRFGLWRGGRPSAASTLNVIFLVGAWRDEEEISWREKIAVWSRSKTKKAG
jgi:hypothetical protein